MVSKRQTDDIFRVLSQTIISHWLVYFQPLSYIPEERDIRSLRETIKSL